MAETDISSLAQFVVGPVLVALAGAAVFSWQKRTEARIAREEFDLEELRTYRHTVDERLANCLSTEQSLRNEITELKVQIATLNAQIESMTKDLQEAMDTIRAQSVRLDAITERRRMHA